jgi:hypothetical protein
MVIKYLLGEVEMDDRRYLYCVCRYYWMVSKE